MAAAPSMPSARAQATPGVVTSWPGSRGRPRELQLRVGQRHGRPRYHLEVSADAEFKQLVDETWIAGTSAQVQSKTRVRGDRERICAFRCVGPRTTPAGNALRPPRTAGSDQARSLLRLSNTAATVTTGHRDGLVLFNTGMDPTIVSDPNYISSPIGRFLLPKIFDGLSVRAMRSTTGAKRSMVKRRQDAPRAIR